MRVPLYFVNTFTDTLFRGNPAAVCFLDDWLQDEEMRLIAAENRCSETAFCIGEPPAYQLRWFSPTVEVDLCGHATLATAFVLRHSYGMREPEMRFQTRSGELVVSPSSESLDMILPARELQPLPIEGELERCLGVRPQEVFRAGPTFIAVYGKAETISAMTPDLAAVSALDCNGVAVTAPGRDVDFVSRFFGPQIGMPEDPVTGSSHCGLIPYWSMRTGKKTFRARQLSARGGALTCEDLGSKVRVGGQSVLYAAAEIVLRRPAAAPTAAEAAIAARG